MEPQALSTLIEEADALRRSALESIGKDLPSAIEPWFDEHSAHFHELVIDQWRQACRFDELIDYVLYQYGESGGDEVWEQVLLDLRISGERAKANRLLDGLYHGRVEAFWAAVDNFSAHPGNHFSAANVAKHKGSVMKVLYEQAYLAENCPKSEKDDVQIARVRARMQEVLSEQRNRPAS